jgi:dTDP-4-dehydrorhamnose 3,5-epimerase
MLYAPRGFAHGFQTLLDNTLVSYQISGRYSPSHSRVIRWDDAEFAIKWPALPTVLSERDRGAKA